MGGIQAYLGGSRIRSGSTERRQTAWVMTACAASAPGWILGGVSGTCFYAATLPIDRIKVLMQTQPGGRARSLRDCVDDVLFRRRGGAGAGVAAFYRGVGPTLARTFVGQAVALSVYDAVVRAGSRRRQV